MLLTLSETYYIYLLYVYLVMNKINSASLLGFLLKQVLPLFVVL